MNKSEIVTNSSLSFEEEKAIERMIERANSWKIIAAEIISEYCIKK